MKKILCMLIALMMLPFNCVFASKYADVEEGSSIEATVKFLSEMGIINGYDDDTFRGQDNLTRAEFAVIVARMLRLHEQIDSSNVYYIDVPASHWAAGSIEQLTENNYLSGKGNGYFGINENVTVEEAATVLLRICGYEAVANMSGGFPSGYSKVASDTKLLKNLSKKTAEITRNDMAKLVENAFNLGMYDFSGGSGGNIGLGVSDKTILSEYWDMYHTEGIVSAANGTNLYGGSAATNRVTIDSVDYYVKENEDYIDYLGTYVDAYYTDVKGDKELYFISKTSGRNTITRIYYDDIVPVGTSTVSPDYTIKYRYGNGIKTMHLNNSVKVIYNGVCLSSFTLSIFDISYGYLELIETQSNGIGVVKIWNLETCYVTSVDTDKRFVYGENITPAVDLSEGNSVCIIKNRANENIDFSAISKKNILTVARYNDVIRAYVSEESFDANVSSVKTSENAIIADEENYKLVPSYSNTFSTKYGTGSVKLYLDVFGNIAYAEGKKEDGETFAYLIDGKYRRKEDKIRLKLFLQDGSMQYMFLSEKVRIDGDKYTDHNDQLNALSDTSGNVISQLVIIKLNSDNEIKYIDTPKLNSPTENEYTLSENIPFNSAGYRFKWNGSIGGKGVMNDSTIIFVVPKDIDVKSAEDRKFSMAKRNDYGDNTSLPLVSYKTSPKIGYEQVCVVKKDMNGTMKDTEGCVVISKLIKTLNSDEEAVTKIEGYVNGIKKEIFATTDSGIEVNTFKKGDVVRFALNSFGEATSNYSKEVSIDAVMSDTTPIWAPSNDTASIDANYKKTYGVPYESEGGILRVSFLGGAYTLGGLWNEVYEMNGTYTLVDYSGGTTEIKSCKVEDIHTYDVYGNNC
ncbi:MAG: S-layer homology domain-containing protein, partial [Clostridia bacterium]|nr:S-layer homology domain-containing protein [Clostridia bacterium]